MHYASNAYAKTAIETAGPRELEASLLLQAAAKLQAVHDSWRDKPPGLNDALLYNRRLWTIFLDAVMSEKQQAAGRGPRESQAARRVHHGARRSP